jgi:hypothetical protein
MKRYSIYLLALILISFSCNEENITTYEEKVTLDDALKYQDFLNKTLDMFWATPEIDKSKVNILFAKSFKDY